MKVGHLQCVPLSCLPLGPSGRLHIQKDLPQFTPGFLVTMVLHGSPCSQRGAIGLAKSLPQVCFVANDAASSSSEGSDSACETGSLSAKPLLVSDTAFEAMLDVEEDWIEWSVVATVVVFGVKKPFRLCWPLVPVGATDSEAVLFRLVDGIEVSVFAVRLPLMAFELADDVETVIAPECTSCSSPPENVAADGKPEGDVAEPS